MFLLKHWEETGLKPLALQNRPESSIAEQFYLDVFTKVSKYRQYSAAGPLPIPVEDALLSYCTYYGIHNVEQRESLADAIAVLDETYLTNAYKDQKTT